MCYLLFVLDARKSVMRETVLKNSSMKQKTHQPGKFLAVGRGNSG